MERHRDQSGHAAGDAAILENMSAGGITVFRVVLRLFFGVIVGGLFAMLGGLLGVALFKKKDLPPPGTVEVLPPVSGSVLAGLQACLATAL